MSAQRLEAFLASLYVDEGSRKKFMVDPELAAREAGFDKEQCEELARMDMVGLVMASRSFEWKRKGKRNL